MLSAGRTERIVLLSSIGLLVFLVATIVADRVVGPCLVWSFGAGLKVASPIDWSVPLAVQASCLYAVGRVARRALPEGPLSWRWRVLLWNPVPAVAALALLVAVGADERPGPPLYRLLGTDASNLLWIFVTALTALLPFAQYLALDRGSTRAR